MGVTASLDPFSAARLQKKMQRIEREFATKPNTELAKFLKLAGEELATKIKKQPAEIMPVITGRLRSSVHSKHTPTDAFLYSDKDGKAFSGGLTEPIKEGEEVVVGTNVEYAFKVNARKGFMTKAKMDFMPIFERNLKQLAAKVVKG